jgi:hypothetical protein
MLRQQADKIGATTVKIDANHFLFLTQPRAAADVIDQAARSRGAQHQLSLHEFHKELPNGHHRHPYRGKSPADAREPRPDAD